MDIITERSSGDVSAGVERAVVWFDVVYNNIESVARFGIGEILYIGFSDREDADGVG